jgi:DNA-directed RNA polymerase subunit M/transcription elongation factor TFIIS
MSYISLNSFDTNTGFRLPEEKSLNAIFKEHTNLNNEQIKNLLTVRNYNNVPVLNLETNENNEISFIFETIGMIKEYGYDKALQFVKNNIDKVSEKSILSSFIFEQQARKFKEETVKLRTKIVVNSVGIFKCNKCGSKDTSYTSKQTRSGDEGETFYVGCNSCGNFFVVG